MVVRERLLGLISVDSEATTDLVASMLPSFPTVKERNADSCGGFGAGSRKSYFLLFLPVAFFLAEGLTAVFLADAFLAGATFADAALAFLAAGAAELLLLPLLNADSQPSEYFFIAPTRTIVTVVSLESFLVLHDVRPPWSAPPVQLP